MNPVHASCPTIRSSILILSYHLHLGFQSGLLFRQVSAAKTLNASLLCPTRATCPAHLILFDLITRTIFGEQQWSLSPSLCSLLHSSVALSPVGQNTFLAPYSRTPSVQILPSEWQTTFHIRTWQWEKLRTSLYVLTFIFFGSLDVDMVSLPFSFFY